MRYWNQLDWPDVPYPTNMKDPQSEMAKGNIARAGCGICSAAMMLDTLTEGVHEMRDLRDLAVSCGANMDPGTDMKIFGKALCEAYGLRMVMSNDLKDLTDCLKAGGKVIVNTGGDHDGYTGVFSHGGHYIFVLSVHDDTAAVLDPSWKEGKYEEEGRQGKVRFSWPFAYCNVHILEEDTQNRDPGYYCFYRMEEA